MVSNNGCWEYIRGVDKVEAGGGKVDLGASDRRNAPRPLQGVLHTPS